MTSRPSDEGEFFSCAYWNQFSKNKTSGIANCIKTNCCQFLQLQSCVQESSCLSSARLCVAECLCSESAVWEIHWSSVGLHTGALFCPERPPQRCIQWAPNTLLNIILLFVKNGSWFLLMVRLVESNRGHEPPQALICLYPHLKTGEVHFICHFFGRRSFLVKLNHSNVEKWRATICINRYHQIDVVVCF